MLVESRAEVLRAVEGLILREQAPKLDFRFHIFSFPALEVPLHGAAPRPLCSIHAIVSTSPILCHIKLLQVSKDQQETMDQCAHRSAASWSGVLWALITARICTSSILFVWRIPSPITGWHKGVDLDNMYGWNWVWNNTVTDKRLHDFAF